VSLDRPEYAPGVAAAVDPIVDRFVDAGLLLTRARRWEVEHRVQLSGRGLLGTAAAGVALVYAILLPTPVGLFWDIALVVALAARAFPGFIPTYSVLDLRRSHGAERALLRLCIAHRGPLRPGWLRTIRPRTRWMPRSPWPCSDHRQRWSRERTTLQSAASRPAVAWTRVAAADAVGAEARPSRLTARAVPTAHY
jgi:hypothetical protein